MPYEVRAAEAADRGVLLDLVRLSATGDMPERWWTWLAERNPNGPAVAFVAEERGKGTVMGAAALFPQRMTFQGRDLRGALAGLLQRGSPEGVAAALSDALRGSMRRHAIEVAVARAPGLGVTGPRGAGTRDITTVARYVRPVNMRAVGVHAGPVDRALSRIFIPYTRAHVEPATFHDTRVSAVWRGVRDHVALGFARDADFYTWRFVTSPSQTEQAYVIKEGSIAIATCALERVENRLRIVDLVARKTHWGSALRAILHFAGEGCDKVEMRLTPEQAGAHSLWRHGFVRRFGDDLPVTIMLPEGTADPALCEPRRWFFTGAENF